MASAAPACKAALAEATRLWPARSIASDGILSSAEHRKQNPRSGHDLGNAFDLTHDPDHGCDAHHLAQRAIANKGERVLYVISRRRIWSRARWSEGWRPYTGENPHDAHAHFELDPDHRDSTWPWWPSIAAPPPPPEEDDDMALAKDRGDQQVAKIRELYWTYLGRGPDTVENVLWWCQLMDDQGLDAVVLGIADSPEGLAYAAAKDRLLGIAR